MPEITFDEQFKATYDLLEHSKENFFLTGKAGTGKSTLLSYFKQSTKKNLVVLAPTGVAALNIKGQTIHSFFGFKPGVTEEIAKKLGKKNKKKDFFSSIEMIIIDEISMVRSDLLDCIDVFLKAILNKKTPFGGLRMVFIGDMYQLPPVVTGGEKLFFVDHYDSPYFFSAKVMKDFKLSYIEMEKVYRQSEQKFIDMLNAIRKNIVSDELIHDFNKRVISNINDEGYIYLTTTNETSWKINEEKLSKIQEKSHEFSASLDGDFDLKIAPTEKVLKLKVGAQVMCLMNHPQGFFVNGTVGRIIDISEEELLIELENKDIVPVGRYEWILYKYEYNEQEGKIYQEDIGSFKQFPLKLAWAITIHKSQGKTFEKVIIDLERGAFAHGQVYVALSRCKSLENLILKKPLRKNNIFMDAKVVNFLTDFQYRTAEKKLSLNDKVALLQNALEEKREIEITYLKANDQKTKRKIIPLYIGQIPYQGSHIYGLEAFCLLRREKRIFKIDRILEIESK